MTSFTALLVLISLAFVRILPTSEDCRNVVTSDITTVEVCPNRLREHGISHAIVISCSLFTPGQAVYVSPLFITAKNPVFCPKTRNQVEEHILRYGAIIFAVSIQTLLQNSKLEMKP
ncbi:hypothetical protein IV203_010282 [Nitzschia inconspicua]|uniref:Uncharacterized protein n=1 Tax=Nitzschia inconspicua TaxID=303405 RepID=A0A9K3PKC3_9STRA|nr:hypothetical protein IV203_010282 [Nitzschia inconspicua]